MYEVELKVYGESCLVPVLVVPGQRDDLIIGTNVIKFLMHRMKISDLHWRILSNSVSEPPSSCEQFLDVMANTCCWRGGEPPDKVGTVKLQQSVTLMAKQEHLVWGRLPSDAAMSPGSTVIVEATSSRTMPQDIIIGHVVTPLWGDRWVPLKVTNLSEKPVTLKRNRKLVDVFLCLAVEDFELLQGFSHAQVPTSEKISRPGVTCDLKQRLGAVSLSDFDIDSCSASDAAKERLVQLLESYNDVFSKHALDCGEVRGFVHRIRLTDEYTAFVTPVGLHEYNRMPQGLCNSPASFMRMMLSIFGDLNFSSLLCYLDDLLVFAPDETAALERLEIVFQ